MSDLHLRILTLIARRTQSALDHHDTLPAGGDKSSAARRGDLEGSAARARAHAAAARARRRLGR